MIHMIPASLLCRSPFYCCTVQSTAVPQRLCCTVNCPPSTPSTHTALVAQVKYNKLVARPKTQQRSRQRMYSTMMRSWCMVLTLLVFFCQCSKGFVVLNPSQPRASLTSRAGRCDIMGASRENEQPAPWSSVPSSSHIEGGCGWRTSAGLRGRQWRRRGGRGVQRNRAGGGGGGGVGSLRAGMDTPVFEVVEYLGKALIEQSVRHHYPSAFIGGTVGVLGTLTAIQVRACVRVFRCRCPSAVRYHISAV